MAIKIQGSTIIDDSRKVINASHVGIGTTNPTVELDVDGQANISGIVTAAKYVVEGGSSTGFLRQMDLLIVLHMLLEQEVLILL